MRFVPLISAALILCVSGPAFAQGSPWTEYVSRADFFSISFPGAPKVQDTTYLTEYRLNFPARVYSVEDGQSRYSVTVVDYRNAVETHLEQYKSCLAAKGIDCREDGNEEVRGALVYASANFIKRDGAKVTHYGHYNSDLIEGHELHLINANGSRTFAVIHMHENRLYILEATVPRSAPAPALFQVSVRFLDNEWKPVRYSWQGTQLYSNGYPPPPRAGQGRGQGAGQQGQGQQDQGQQGR